MVDVFGLYVDEDIDPTCYDVEAWPEPEAGTYEMLYMDMVMDDELGYDVFQGVGYHTMYSVFQEGDVKRIYMDLANKAAGDQAVGIKAVREANKFSGQYCIYWDNWDGFNPQPWKVNDCALQALFLNDEYYACAGDDALSYCDDLGTIDYDGDGCLEEDADGNCLEYECVGEIDDNGDCSEDWTPQYGCDTWNADANSGEGGCDCYDADPNDSNICLDYECKSGEYDDYTWECIVTCDTWYDD